MEQIVSEALINSVMAQEAFVKESRKKLIDLACLMVITLRQGGKILIFGNGGSAADAQHMAAEFVNRFLIKQKTSCGHCPDHGYLYYYIHWQ